MSNTKLTRAGLDLTLTVIIAFSTPKKITRRRGGKKMLATKDILNILNNNNRQKKYTIEEANKIKQLLYQLGEIAYLQFKETKQWKEQ